MDLSYSSATRPNSVPVPAGSIVSVQAVQLPKPYRDYSDLEKVLQYLDHHDAMGK